MSVTTRAEARQLTDARRRELNNQVIKLQEERGIYGHTDVSIGEALRIIKGLMHIQGDQGVIGRINWHEASLLTAYRTTHSPEWQRDHMQYGVYEIFELVGNKFVPRFVEATPRYVGRSDILSQRLRHHAMGGRGSTPAARVTEELHAKNPVEKALYDQANGWEQRRMRGEYMRQRGLWVRTVHTKDHDQAVLLEKHVTRDLEAQGISLWGKIKFKTGNPFTGLVNL